jgi:hypothetical protein
MPRIWTWLRLFRLLRSTNKANYYHKSRISQFTNIESIHQRNYHFRSNSILSWFHNYCGSIKINTPIIVSISFCNSSCLYVACLVCDELCQVARSEEQKEHEKERENHCVQESNRVQRFRKTFLITLRFIWDLNVLGACDIESVWYLWLLLVLCTNRSPNSCTLVRTFYAPYQI